VLDIMLPGESGLELSAALTEAGNSTPILLLTAMVEPEDRVRGLEAGAEDYMVKPFEPRELVLRIRTILRRRGSARRETLRFGPLAWSAGRDTLEHEDGTVRPLAPAEALLLSDRVSVMSQRPGRVILEREAPFPRPRYKDVSQSAEFKALYDELINALDSQ